MSPPRRMLPPAPVMAEEVRRGVAMSAIARRYKVDPQTVSNRLQEWCRKTGQDWPLVAPTKSRRRLESVPIDLARAEVHRILLQYRMPTHLIAQHAGLSRHCVMRIINGQATHILRETQGKLLLVGIKLDAGEITYERTVGRSLPVVLRDQCPNGHPYTKARDGKGHRRCNVCRATWEREQRQSA